MDVPQFEKPNYTYRATVTRIVDGDTIDVDLDLGCHVKIHRRLRFLGIDTWEIRGSEKVEGYKAKERLEDLIEGNEVFIQTVMDAEGKYGRLLAWVWIETHQEGPLCVNQVLLEEGHGEEVTY